MKPAKDDTHKKDAGADRRKYYRVTCRGNVDLMPIPEHTSDLSALFRTDAALDSRLSYGSLEEETRSLLSAMSEQDVRQTQLLRLMNQKLDILADTLLKKGKNLAGEVTDLDLSEGGMAFETPTRYPRNQTLAARLILLPGPLRIIMPAMVRSCEQTDDHLFKLHLEFTDQPSGDADALLRYLVREQRRQLQASKRKGT